MENLFFIDVSRFDEERNKTKLKVLRALLKTTDNVSNANYILAIGGDGCLLNSISNYKHITKEGEISDCTIGKLKFSEFHLVSMPLLDVKAVDHDGEEYRDTAFGDVWVERKEAQSLKYNICVETDTVPVFCSKNKFISGDGILFSTAAGSTGYARNILGVVMPIGTKNMLVAPIHSTVDKRKMNGFTLNPRSSIKIDIYDGDFRIPRLNIDGQTVKSKNGEIFVPKNFEVSASEDTVTLAFIDEHYLELKSFDYLIN